MINTRKSQQHESSLLFCTIPYKLEYKHKRERGFCSFFLTGALEIFSPSESSHLSVSILFRDTSKVFKTAEFSTISNLNVFDKMGMTASKSAFLFYSFSYVIYLSCDVQVPDLPSELFEGLVQTANLDWREFFYNGDNKMKKILRGVIQASCNFALYHYNWSQSSRLKSFGHKTMWEGVANLDTQM